MRTCPTSPAGFSPNAAMMPGRELGAFELRFRSLFKEGRGYSFPCDARGGVDMDELSDRARLNYLFARALVGRDLHAPEVVTGGRAGRRDQ